MALDMQVKRHGGAVAFIELNDESVWQVGIVPRYKIDTDNLEEFKDGKYYHYAMYSNRYCGFIDKLNVVNPEIQLIQNTNVNFYGIIISEDMLPLGKIKVLCYKRTGIEEFKEEM